MERLHEGSKERSQALTHHSPGVEASQAEEPQQKGKNNLPSAPDTDSLTSRKSPTERTNTDSKMATRV